MSKRNPTKPTSRSKSKRFLDPKRKLADISQEKNFKFSNPRHRLATPEDLKKFGLDEEEFIIFL